MPPLLPLVAASIRVERLNATLVAFLGWIGSLGWSGLAIVAVLYVPLAVAALPVWPLTVAAGFFFGVGWAVVVASFGSTLGAAAAFFVGRRIGRAAILRGLGDRSVLTALDQAVSQQGFTIVVLTRLSPLLPYNLLNYAFALTGVSARTFVLASWIGMLPVTVMYASIGAAAESLAELYIDPGDDSTLAQMLFIVGVGTTVLVMAMITRAARRALRKAMGDGTPPHRQR